MKLLIRLAVRVYPARWRRRYAREFEALLEDVGPGWGVLMNVFRGGLTMQMKRLAAIPVLCALAGALAGGIIASRAPRLFASAATIRLQAPQAPAGGVALAQDLRVSVDDELGNAGGTGHATYVTLLKGDSRGTFRVVYLDPDPAQAQRVAERLAAAIVKDARRSAAAENDAQRSAAAEVLEPAALPRTPVDPPYASSVAAGGGVGLVAGAIVLLLARARRALSRVD